jgi:hypothetical protein
MDYEQAGIVLVNSAAIRSEDEGRFVFLYENGILQKRFIETGVSHMNQTQVISGLVPGQRVVLR